MAFFAQQIVIRAFYSLQNSKLPAVTAIIAVVLNVILNLTLIWPLATGGLALSTSVCAYTQVIILTFLLRRKLGAGLLSDFGRTVIHTIIATVIMTIVTGLVLLAMKGLEETTKFDILRLVLAVPIAAGTYYVTARFLKSEELSLVHRRTGK
jgi:putative peptidoglycan lipid II flippase